MTFDEIWMVALMVKLIILRAEKFHPVIFNMKIGGTDTKSILFVWTTGRSWGDNV